MQEEYKILFEPVKIGNVEIKNRFLLAPMGPLGLGDAEGAFNQRGVEYYTQRAKGGTGLIVTGVTFSDYTVEEHTCPGVPVPTKNEHQFVRTGKEMTERIHAYGSKIFLMMSGGFGRVSVPEDQGADNPVAPSPIMHRWVDKICHELTVDEIHHIVKSFGEGAKNAKRAGFDGIMIHAVHEGYLIDQFAISMFNQRTDEYGGSLENRLRFAREIREEIAKTCGWDFPVVMRYGLKSFIKDWRKGAMPGEEFEEKGRDIPEGLEAAKLLEQYGYDALDVDVGSYDSWWWSHPPMYQEKGLYLPYARMVKEVVKCPILCAGRMDDPDLASDAVRKGWIDMVSLGRPLLADPDYVNKLRAGHPEDIRPCISCQEGCIGRIQNFSMINCAVNPQCAREQDYAYRPIYRKKKVVIVGGGVAGMEAARVLAIRGHEPVIYEKTGKLGGALAEAGVPSFKEDDRALIKWYVTQMEKLGVEIHFHTEVTREMLLGLKYDTLIIATGALPKMFPLGEDKPVLDAKTVLREKAEGIGDKIVVIGGGMVGCELALWLRKDLGKDVTVVEALHKLLAVNAPICSANRDMLEQMVPFSGCRVMLKTTAVKTTPKGLLVKNLDTGAQEELEADTVVLAVGFKSDASLYDAMQDAQEIYKLGDCREFKNVHQAVWDAYEVANHIE
ncbi:MAG: FAD-dependent oxidoreductase [Oscillospiraceae bacterium]|nr:FAD-dependent oxidoreductase [Oscillospiraceae bacterium]